MGQTPWQGRLICLLPLLVLNYTHPLKYPNSILDPYPSFLTLEGWLSRHLQDNPETMLEDKKATQLWSLGDSEDVLSLWPFHCPLSPTFHSGVLSLGPILSLKHLLGIGPSMIKFLPVLILSFYPKKLIQT